jgi:hypothetical protein
MSLAPVLLESPRFHGLSADKRSGQRKGLSAVVPEVVITATRY